MKPTNTDQQIQSGEVQLVPATSLHDSEISDPKDECPSCLGRRDRLQSIGTAVYFVSLFSCGTLMPIALPTGMIIQILLLRKCKKCRIKAKSQDISQVK